MAEYISSSGWIGLDNGPDATKEIQKALSDCKTIIWNGPSKLVAWRLDGEMWWCIKPSFYLFLSACCPVYTYTRTNMNTIILLSFPRNIALLTLAVGVFEMEAFSKGTFAIASTLAELTDKVVRQHNNEKSFTRLLL